MRISEAAKILKNKGVGILPTDTIYGLVGSALAQKTVERIYKLRKRNLKKPMIILIGSFKDLEKFKIKLDKRLKKILTKFWPGPVSIILPCSFKEFSYLHRGGKSLAFRLPKNKNLIKILLKTGPLVAPSANPEGLKSAIDIAEAKKYFKNKVDFYINKGKIKSKPSIILEVKRLP